MADKSVGELIAAQSVTPTDLFVLEQNGTAKKLTGQILENWLVSFADGHGGIQNIEKVSTSGLVDTYRIALADTTTFDFVVTNGKGVSGVSKTGTSGLVDTYTISYNDGTSDTFTVTNGEKGEKGDNQYVWIKYASQKPTEDSPSFGDVADNWIGVYSGDSETAPSDWTLYEWFEIKGEKGDTGDPATLTSSKVEYQVSDSGTIIPSGAWSESVPVVPQGKYLWTRTNNTFNTGSPVVSYSVSRMGLDGTGSVSSVANISPDANGNVPLTAEHVGAVPSTGGEMTGELKMNGQPISGLNMPVTNDQAANMGFVNQQVRKAAPGNLLDNSDFTNPVNQRGNSAYTGTGSYTIDRWAHTTGLNVTVGEGKVILTNVQTDDFDSFYQKFEPGKIVSGKTYTFAVKTVDGTVHTGVVAAPESSGGYTDIPIGTSAFFRMALGSDELYNFRICVYISNTLELVWAALYEGEYTAETLPEYHPKGYGTELRECQRYFVKMTDAQSGYGHISSTTNIWVVLFVPCTMRTTPTITFGGTIGIYAAGKNYINFTPTGTVGHKGNMIRFSASRESTSELPEKEPLTAYWSEPMTFSADL